MGWVPAGWGAAHEPPVGKRRAVSSISASSPLQSYLALPSPASVRASDAKRTTAKATNATADSQAEDVNELPPIAPIAPVTRQSQQVDNENEQSGDGNSGNGTSNESAGTSTSTGSAPVGQFSAAAAATSAAASSRQTQSRATASSAAGQASAGFVTQSLSQETIGAGLHIEPWRAAISSYLSAAALPSSASWSNGMSQGMVSMTV